VVGFADSGFYLDTEMFTPLKAFVTSPAGQNATGMLSASCKRHNPSAPERCLVAQAAAGFLRTALFAFQSRYDLDQRTCEMSSACALSPECIEAYGRNSTSAMHTWLASSNMPHGAFMDGCSRHCDGPTANVSPLKMHVVGGTSPLQALATWYTTRAAMARRVWQQSASFPCGACCG
jgi:hypothetical protein